MTLVERREVAGQGVAFSASDLRHLLNVPAAKMSAFGEDSEHLREWLARTGRAVEAYEFVPRAWYGEYLAETLADAERAAPGSLERHHAVATAVTETADGFAVALADGRVLDADGIVLALGHLGIDVSWAPPELAGSGWFVADPWTPGALESVPEDGDVLVVGTGLTMVDVVRSVDRPHRRIHAISRHGAFPHRHAPAELAPMEPPEFSSPTPSLAELREVMTAHVGAASGRYGDWRPAIDSVRSITQRLWGGLTEVERKEFVELDARTWDSMRHRIPPASADAVEAIGREGRLLTRRAHVVSAAPVGDRLSVGLSDGTRLEVAVVINCTGPCDRPQRSDDPLVVSLLESGLVRPGPLGIGLDTMADGRVIDATGSSSRPIWTLAALRKGSLWESVAIPEIRDQAAGLGRALIEWSVTDQSVVGSPSARQPR